MMDDIRIEGNAPIVTRLSSGLWGLDHALSSRGETGIPINCVYEIYGYPNAGKSSLAYYLGGRINRTGKIVLCDLEKFDPEYLRRSLRGAGFAGVVRLVDMAEKKKSRPHDEMVRDLADALVDPEVSCGILDSVGAFIPIQEEEGDATDANMGRRALAMGKFVRRSVHHIQVAGDKEFPPRVLFLINHVHSVLGGRGHNTPGGEAIKYASAARLYIYTDEVITNSDKIPICFVAQGKVEKLKFGGRGQGFKFAILPDIGVSPEMTALIDCVELGLATRGTTVSIKDKSLGFISKFVKAAKENRKSEFEPFFDALNEYDMKGVADGPGLQDTGNQ